SDGGDGYAGARRRLLAPLRDQRVPNPVTLGGDIHSFWVTDLQVDPVPSAPAVATEFVSTSLTSPGIPYELMARTLPDTPHVRFFESRARGYVRCTVSPDRWRAELRALEHVTDARAPIGTLATYVVESGRPGAQRA